MRGSESASPTELLGSYLAVPYQSLDRTGTIQAVNEAWTELSGYDESLLGTPFAELLGDGSRDRFETWLEECERSPPPRKLPLDITDAAGHTRTVELSGRVESSEAGDIYRIHCQLRDITKYQRNRQNSRTYREAVENSGHSIFWTDTEGHIEYVNPMFEAITGYSPEEVIGETPSLLSSGVHDDSFYDDLWGTIKAGNVWQGEIINERKSGEQYVVWQTISPITDDTGEITRYVAVNHDITDRKQREQRLELKTETTKHAPIGIVLTDPTTDLNQVVYANDGFTELTGYTRSEILGRSCRLLYGDKTDPETVATIEDHVGNNQPVTERVTHHRKSGTPFWTLLTIVPIRDHNRTVVYHARFFRDITTRRTQLRHLQMIDRVLRHNL
jgi:PAS domain S-box-containing protein